jgi:hypothetical protein
VAIDTWKSLGLWDLIEQHVLTAGGIVDLFFTIAPQIYQIRRGMWCTTMWSLWKIQNLKLWGEVDEDATTLLNQWQWAHLNDSQGAGQVAWPTYIKWEIPPLGKVNCNVDAAFGDNKVGIDMCIRDHNSNTIEPFLPSLLLDHIIT